LNAARKVEPPTHYVQHASKAKKSTKLSATGKKKTKGGAIKNEKMIQRQMSGILTPSAA
jgi:hypothetical protein